MYWQVQECRSEPLTGCALPTAGGRYYRARRKGWAILLERGPKMRSTATILAVFILGSPAVALSWEEYSYPDYAFSVDFPAKPLVENRTHQVADNRSVPALVYSVRQNSSELKVTIADLANTGLDEASVIDYAIKTLSAGGAVTFNIPQRIDSVYGRSVGIQRGDGSRSMIGVFDYHGRLYQIRPKHSPAGVTRQPKHCASTSRWCSPTAVRTVPRIRSALIVKPVPTLSDHLRASTTHAALVMPANEMAR